MSDPTRIDVVTDPRERRLYGTTAHGWIDFDVPYMTEVAPNLWQGGCARGLVLPADIKHVVSLYPWERYRIDSIVDSELYVRMFDTEDQDLDQVDQLARWVNECRDSGPVLVHCQAGLNRSSLIVARAIYISEQNAVADNEDYIGTGAEIMAHLREKRSPGRAVQSRLRRRGVVMAMKHYEYIVIMPRIEGNPEIGYSTAYYSDMKRCQTIRGVIRHGAVDLQQSDDFLIGKVEGTCLVRLQWMDEMRDDDNELSNAAAALGLSVPEVDR